MGHTPVWPGRRVQVQGQVTTPSPSRPPGKALRMGLTPTGDTVLSHVPHPGTVVAAIGTSPLATWPSLQSLS